MRSRRMRQSALAVACCTLVVALPFTVLMPAAAHADIVVSLPISGADSLLVSDDYVFISPGAGGSSILVRDLNGAAVGTVADQPGAMAMSASADGSRFYVALHDASAISVIDPTTLTELTRYDTSALGCPSRLVSLGSVVWFTYGCGGSHGIGAVNTDAATPAPESVIVPDVLTGIIAGNHGAPDKLFATHGTTATVYALTGTTATPVTSAHHLGCHWDAAVTSDGSSVLMSCGDPTVKVFSMSDLSEIGSYRSTTHGDGVSVSSTGHVASSSTHHTRDVRAWTATGVETLHVGFDHLGEGVLHNTLEWSPDGSRLFAISNNEEYGKFKLRIFTDAVRTASSIALSAPTTVPLDSTVTVTGTLTLRSGGSAAGRALTVSRRNYDGNWTTLPEATTGSGGAFSFTDAPKGGPVMYAVEFLGDESNRSVRATRSLTVSRLTTSVKLARSTSLASYGRYVKLTAHLGPHHEVNVVSIYAKRYGANSWSLIKHGTVDQSGNLRVSYKMVRRTAFRATFSGDDRYNAAAATTTVRCRSITSITSVGHYGTSGAYRLFRSNQLPTFVAEVTPNKESSVVTFVVQRYYNAAWRTVSSRGFWLDRNSRKSASYDGARIGSRYRVKARYGGDWANTASASPWLYFKVTR